MVAGISSVAFVATSLPALPAYASEENSKVYSYDDFTIKYSVVDEWEGHKNIQVNIENTSDEPIYNWAFKFDANGKIGEMWGAEKLDCIDNEYVIGSVDYDSKIKKSVSFGYILECDDETAEAPKDFELCSKRIDLSDGYEISMNVLNEWKESYTGEVVITNTSDKPIVGWNLLFNNKNNISCIWNGNLKFHDDDKYLIASGDYDYYIEPGSNVKIGFLADKTDDEVIITDSFELSAVVRDWEFDETPDFSDTKDTDGDLLPDVYEIHVYGTDPKKVDTDGDGLPDGYEVITLRSNPRELDSDNNGITDDKEDFDSDELTNYEEFSYGTNPYSLDTDEDELSDYDEINTYGTDPLKYDTDDDTIWDCDEIKLGLNPTDSSDADTPVKQIIEEDEMEINDINDDFKISLDITASNYVKDYLIQEESPYAAILSDNRSIIGTPVNIEYDAGEIVEGTISFRMNEETINGAAHYFEDYDTGLERYGIFIFDEEIGTIVPVPAIYDEESKTISIDASVYTGNLMIIDYESLMYDLGIDPRRTDDEEETEEIVSDERSEEIKPTEEPETSKDEESMEEPSDEKSFVLDESLEAVTTVVTDDFSDEGIESEELPEAVVTEAEDMIAKESEETDSDSPDSDTVEFSDTVPASAKMSSMYSIIASSLFDETPEADMVEESVSTAVDETISERLEIESVVTDAVTESNVSILSASAVAKAEVPEKAVGTAAKASSSAWRQVDLVIVIDTTGSMSGSISTVRNNLTNLIDKLRDDNISLYVSLIDFKDITCGEPTILNNNNGKQFYSSMQDVKSAISGMIATGGGDTPETDIDGLGQAYNLNYRSSASKYLFLITDTYYKNNNNFGFTSLEEVADKLHNKGIMTNIIVPTDCYKTYAPLVSDPEKSKIAINTAFCDTMYDIICNSDNSSDAVVIGSNLVTGCFKETLKYGGSCNSDADGLTDSEEVDWGYVKKLDKSTGEYELYTWKELCELSKWFTKNPYKDGKYNLSFNALKDIKVVPALSNPFSSDSDGDYYPDDVEDVSRRLERDSMYISDANLYDGEFNEVNTSEPSKYTDGKLVVNSQFDETNKQRITTNYKFTRKTNTYWYFDLEPEHNSFYKFDSDAYINRKIKVTYNKFRKTKTVSEENGTYALEAGVKYTVSFYAEADYGATCKECIFTIAQDNWKYAPNGGKWEVTKYGSALSSSYSPYSQIYISPKLLIESTVKVLPSTTEYDIFTCYTLEDVDAVLAKLTYSDPSVMSIKDEAGAALTVGGVVVLFVSYAVPGIREGSVLYTIISGGGAVSTLGGGVLWFSDLMEKMENARIKEVIEEGNFSIQCSHFTSTLGNVWDPWSEVPYIHKVQFENFGKITEINKDDVIAYCGW